MRTRGQGYKVTHNIGMGQSSEGLAGQEKEFGCYTCAVGNPGEIKARKFNDLISFYKAFFCCSVVKGLWEARREAREMDIMGVQGGKKTYLDKGERTSEKEKN